MADRAHLRERLRTAVVWDALRPAVEEQAARTGRSELDILDVGGGTGAFAVPLAGLGHRVTVLDPSPDALATLERRAAEAGVGGRIKAVPEDAANLLEVVGRDGQDVVLCHRVLEHVEDPAQVLAGAAAALRSGGLASVLVSNRNAAVLARAVAGHIDQARHALTDPAGRWGAQDPLPRRFGPEEAAALVAAAGLTAFATHGVRVCSELVPGGLVESEPGAVEALLALEAALSNLPAFQSVATQLHLLARRG
ncbi:MAG: methyltransferase [Sporichthyaceae bacterium]